MRPGALLEEALGDLAAAAARLAAGPAVPGESGCRRMRAMGPGPRDPRPVRAPLRRWQALRQGDAGGLDARTARYLCWEADVAADPAFLAHLDGEGVELDGRALQGLLRSVHARWSPAVQGGEAVGRLRARLARRASAAASGRLADRLAARWGRELDLLLGDDGPARLARRIEIARQPVDDACRAWALAPRTAYVRAAVCLATWRCRDRLDDLPEAARGLFTHLLPWAGWEAAAFRREVAATILRLPGTPAAVRRAGLAFVLGDPRLGDPRASGRPGRWHDMAEARRQVVAWLTGDDLAFFFEGVVPLGGEPGPRWMFWQRYVDAVGVSRVLLCPEDELRWEERRRRGATGPGFGRVSGGDSALVLGFPRVLAVEHARGRTVDLFARQDDDDWLARPAAGGPDLLARPRVRIAHVRLAGDGPSALARALAAHGTVASPGGSPPECAPDRRPP